MLWSERLDLTHNCGTCICVDVYLAVIYSCIAWLQLGLGVLEILHLLTISYQYESRHFRMVLGPSNIGH